MPRIIAVGACYLDTILTIPHYPPEDSKLRATSLSHRRGGNTPNTLEVLSQLPIPLTPHQPTLSLSLSLITVLPALTSVATRKVQASLPGVDTSLCVFREWLQEAASCYVLRSVETGSRTIVNFNELPDMTVEEFVGRVEEVGRKEEGEGCWWHFEGRHPAVTLACVQYLRQRFPEAKISVEAENPGRVGLEEVVALADVVFYSKSWAESRGFMEENEMRAFLEAQSWKIKKGALLCLTWGASGAAALDVRSNEFEYVDGWKPEGQVVVDVVGAGDTFIAGMLYGENVRRSEWSLKEKLVLANELAGRKVLQEGFVGLGDALEGGLP